jgi:pyruvate kinase
MRRAKILATLGPACSDPDTLEKMLLKGVDICRINFSYGSHKENEKLIKLVRKTADKVGKAVAIMLAIQGPKIRIGQLKETIELKENDTVILSGENTQPADNYIPTTYYNIASDTRKGKTILVADGRVILKVESTDPEKKRSPLHCRNRRDNSNRKWYKFTVYRYLSSCFNRKRYRRC